MRFKNVMESQSVEIATLAVFVTGVVAFVLLHSVTLATSHGGQMLTQVGIGWAAFILAVLAAALLLVQE
jgi:hypothetical protein